MSTPELGLRKLGSPLREQTVGEMPPQWDVLGRETKGFSQGLKRIIEAQRELLNGLARFQISEANVPCRQEATRLAGKLGLGKS